MAKVILQVSVISANSLNLIQCMLEFIASLADGSLLDQNSIAKDLIGKSFNETHLID